MKFKSGLTSVSLTIYKTTCLVISALGLTFLAVSCGEPANVAADYTASLASGAAPETTPTPTPGPVSPTPSPATSGDATAGAALMKSDACDVCHGSAIANKVKLDATAIPKLDVAFTGTNKSNHVMLESFKTENRANLEAALKAR